MPPRIRHIAIMTLDQEGTAAFYKKTFGMVEVWRNSAFDNPKRFGLYLSDGYLNLAILEPRPGTPEGIHHFGFQVEDIEEIAKLAEEAGAKELPVAMPQDGRFAEAALKDPVGVRVDVAIGGWRTEPAHNPEYQFEQENKA